VNAELDAEHLRSVVEAATFAPSVHNTQPWRFRWDGAALSVLEDPSRGLPVLDPSGRERVLSCGAAVLNARLAVRELGRDCEVSLLPDPDRPELLARITVTGERAATPEELALVQAVPRRYTDRGAFDGRPVPPEALQRLRAAAEAEGAWLDVVESADDRVALAVLLDRANAAEVQDPAYQAELQRWRTTARAEEGVPDVALGEAPAGGRASEYALRDFDAGGGSVATTGDEPPPAEHPLAVVVGTERDHRHDWLVAGAALGRVLLQATCDGLAASPMTQVVEIEPLRQQLRRELSLVGAPQVVLRLGYGHGEMTTRRRPVDDVLELA
jgi:nitroreductase